MNLQIGVKIIIRNQANQILLIRRTKLLQNETESSWDIPGGRIEVTEHLGEALNRELQEETGITLTSDPQLINAQDIFVPTKDLHVVRLTYVIHENIQNIVLSDEHSEATWLGLDEAKKAVTEPFLKETLKLLT